MKKSKIRPFLLVWAIFFILITVNFSGNKNFEIISFHNKNSNNLNCPNAALYHTTILIDGNGELATFVSNEGLAGNGTYAAPYIIEDLTIRAKYTHGIEIRNTDFYLIIQSCTIYDGRSDYDGIYCNNTSNVNINNNNLTDNNFGIRLRFSNNITLSGNYADNIAMGIILEYSNNNTLSGNNADNNEAGIGLRHSNNNTLSGNNANNNGVGIGLFYSNNNNLSGNDVIFNHHNGISLDHSNNNTLSGNNVSNTLYGIKMDESNNIVLFGNAVSYNTFGFNLYTLISNITIFLNDICGNYIQAIFWGQNLNNFSNIQWDNGTTGNYWGNDYLIKYPDAINDGIFWDTPYVINVDFGIDNFPLVDSIFPDLEQPIFKYTPKNFTGIVIYNAFNISWFALDVHPATYIIELDGNEVIFATAWTNTTAISYEIPDGLLKGDHNITIIITDENGNKAQDTVTFKVYGLFPVILLGSAIILVSVGVFLFKRKTKNQENRFISNYN